MRIAFLFAFIFAFDALADRFDIVIAGLGSSASALVGELLTNAPNMRILAIEAGQLPNDPRIDDPNMAMHLWNSDYNWQYSSTEQKQLQNRTISYAAGKGAGGSSLLNGAVFVHAKPVDYQRWEEAGNDGWGAETMLGIIRGLENYIDRPSLARGSQGPVPVQSMNSLSPFSLDFVRALETFGIPYVDDYNDPLRRGVSFTQQNVDLDGQRVHAYKAFVLPYANDKRLEIREGATVTKVLFDGQRAIGVAYQDASGETKEVFASQYVILSAGTFRSPQILMLSGIGPKEELSKHNIEIIVDLTGVGSNLQDHPTCVVAREVKLNYPLKSTMQNLGFFGETASKQPQFKLQTYHIRNYPPYDPNSFGIGVELQHPQSRGTLRLRSAKHSDAPLIDPNIFAHPNDLAAMVDGLKQAWSWLEYFDAHSQWFSKGRLPRQEKPTNEDFEEFARSHTFPNFHPAGTCKMGPVHDPMAVVDNQLNVRGVSGLKVVDASIMPELPSGNIYATTLAIGIKGARLVLNRVD